MNIQWYPGHMTKTRRMMQENLSLVDVVIEILDARIPYSSKNPDLDSLAKNKFRIIVMNKMDLADEKATAKWCEAYQKQGFAVILVDSVTGKGISEVTNTAKELMKEKIENQKKRGRLFVPIRAMVCGIPNAGKSTFINKYVGKASAKTGDRPGVTRGKQWIKIKKELELLDTPGILWPKFEDQSVGLKLAMTGAVNDDILDAVELGEKLIQLKRDRYPAVLAGRYKIQWDELMTEHEILSAIGEARGFKSKGGEADLLRTAKILLDEFRSGKLGRISLETPDDIAEDVERLEEVNKQKQELAKLRKRAYLNKKRAGQL